MININNRRFILVLRLYVSAALIAAALLSSPAVAFVPVVILIWYLYLWRWPGKPTVNLLSEYFVFLSIAVLLTPQVGAPFATLVAFPVMILIDLTLRRSAETVVFRDTDRQRRLTDTAIILYVIALCLAGISLLLSDLSLLITSAVAVGYLVVLNAIIFWRLPLKPVVEVQINQRMVAGLQRQFNIELINQTVIGGQLIVMSPYEWLTVKAGRLSMKERKFVLRVSLSPPLAGPSVVKLVGYTSDRWGLIQTRFEMEPIRLFVVPRARYAAWLAQKYLTTTKAGPLVLTADISAVRPLYGFNRGIEYYGIQQYQPGDSIKNIDWKHSVKYNDLITKKYIDFHGQPAIIMVNLAVGNAEEADRLAYKIIVTALSLAREGIPAALAVYDNENVKLTTASLAPRQLLFRGLQISRNIMTIDSPMKYLNPPDVIRLRSDIERVATVGSKSSDVLLQLLQLEYKNLEAETKLNPAKRALAHVVSKMGRQATVVMISQRNHDAGALEFIASSLSGSNTSVISV